jgi:predicted transcriptional regulator
MAEIHSIEILLRRGWSQWRIARELGVDRSSVSKVFKWLNTSEDPAGDSNYAQAARCQ